ncbi:MAG: VCBS repeat-containing protein, partial [bacterium]|nr:VCBS repeat-containing protein [bacterium]
MNRWLASVLTLSLAACLAGCAPSEDAEPSGRESLPNGLLLALAVLETGADGKPLPQPARVGILVYREGVWDYRSIEDPDSIVFHKAMAYEPGAGAGGVLTLGGSRAIVKLWRQGTEPEILWEEDFGGKFSRMRDAELADVYGDGSAAIVVATHDQGVVAVVRPDGSGGYTVEELDRQPNTIVHEIELGDLDGDGVIEIYATPSAPNKLDGTP